MDSFLLFHPDSIQIWVRPVGNSDSALAVRISWGVCAVIVAWLLRSQIPLAQRSNLPGRQAEVELKGGVEGQEPALLEPPLSRGSISFSKDMVWRRRGQNHTTTMSPGQNGSKSAALWAQGKHFPIEQQTPLSFAGTEYGVHCSIMRYFSLLLCLPVGHCGELASTTSTCRCPKQSKSRHCVLAEKTRRNFLEKPIHLASKRLCALHVVKLGRIVRWLPDERACRDFPSISHPRLPGARKQKPTGLFLSNQAGIEADS